MRVDYNNANMLSGSVLFLNPNTNYEVKLNLTDPDGGAAAQTLSVKTRPVPVPSTSGRTFHVVPGSGGGDGSASKPFQGVAAAQAVAQPGDTFLLHAGSYGGRIRFDKPGTAANYLVWKGAGDGEVMMNGIDIAASHIWLEGLTIRNQSYATFSIAAPENVVVKRCSFFNNHYSIYLQQGGKDWYIADNTIVGDTPASSESFDGEGIELNNTSGHTIAHNSITNVSDGISYPVTNVDIFGNDIFDVSDDGIEADNGKSNVRMWGNRIHNAVHNAISFQPQNGSPWYIIRNQIVSNKEAPFKFRTTDRFVLLHNTIVNWGSISCCNDHHLFGAYARNNLWISKEGGEIWYFSTYTKDWRTDLDYDGFDWGSATNPFVYGGVWYSNVSSFSTGSGLEKNGRRVSKDTCFANFGELNFTNPSPASVSSVVLTLNGNVDSSGTFISPAINTGVVLPNVNDRFVGDGSPDLGASEYGQAVPSYGPRVGQPVPTATFTASPSTINQGESATLSWMTTDATTVSIDQGVGAVETSGSTVVTPTATTTYILTAEGSGGTTTTSVTVTPTLSPTPTPSPTPSPSPSPTPPPNAAPTVSLTSPTEGATFTAPVNLTINANASDGDGTVAKVEFFQGSTKLGEDTTAPYIYAWGNVAAGTYMLTAKATDNEGATTTSSVVNIAVNSSPADFSVSASPASRNIRRGTQTTYTISATPSGGFTGSVTFSVSTVLPTGVSVSFSPQSVSTSGSSMMTVRTSSTTPTGTYVLIISGTSGSLQRTTSVTLNVRK
jgi:hypothetical protein